MKGNFWGVVLKVNLSFIHSLLRIFPKVQSKIIQEMKKVENMIELEHQMGKYTKEKRKSTGVMFAIRPWNF